MTTPLPDPRLVAEQEAALIRNEGFDAFERAVERILIDAPWLDAATLLDGLETFHAERMAKVPSVSMYPESPAWVEQAIAVDRALSDILNLQPRQIAIRRSLSEFLMFRGYARSGAAPAEKCRVVYLPQTDRGQMHIKNVDDPAPPNWKPNPPPTALPLTDELVWDGVGSGLHFDDEPDEIFPLPITRMYRHYANDVPGAVEFLTRYSVFLGGMNFVLRDRQQRSVAIEKCSRNFIEVFEPDPVSGLSHCSGMVCRDPSSPQGKYQKQKRDDYRKRFGLSDDGSDATFWNACCKAETMLTEGIRSMGKTPTVDGVFKMFTTPWPEGLNKPGVKLHPDQGFPEYTLFTHSSLLDERAYYRWQRDEDLVYPDEPEVYSF